ncbi:MAG: LTA synthase family protein [Rhodanobacteraceae bacterium]
MTAATESAKNAQAQTMSRWWCAGAVVLICLMLVLAALAGAVRELDVPLLDTFAEGTDWGLLILNAVPAALLSMLLLAATRRPVLSIWFGALALALLYAISGLKYAQLATPLLPADFQMIGQIGAGGELLARYLPKDGSTVLRWLLVLLATALVLFESPWPSLRGWWRAASAALAVVVFATLVMGSAPWPSLYSRERLDFEPWSPVHSARAGGLIASLLRYHWEFSAAPAPPDRAAAKALLASHEGSANTGQTRPAAGDASLPPDIVVLQSESFFDPARLRGIDPSQVIPNFRRLAGHAEHGDLWVPTYGGGTIRTEFEVLTGIALRYFPDVQYPYFDLTHQPLPSLVRALAAAGYRTLAVHPNDPSFWNRASAFRAMGFARFDSLRDFKSVRRSGYYVSDATLVDFMLAHLDRDGPPQFLFAISMESHGPYNASPGIDTRRRDTELTTPGLSRAARREMQDYLYHLADADRALGRLAAALMARKRRTLLVFYGDHLPGLTEVYDKAGFDNGLAATAQPVPYLLFDTAAATPKRVDSAAFFLPGQVLAAAGLSDRYFTLTEAIRADTKVGPGFAPADDSQVAAAMQLRQRGELFPRAKSATTGSPLAASAH